MRKSLATPQQAHNRRSMLGFGSAAAKLKRQNVPEQKRLTFSANKTRPVASKRWSSQGTSMKDPRPLTNRGFQKQMIDDILEFLNENGYPHPITQKILGAPTTREFLRVFEFLYGCIDTNFKMGDKFQEEVPKILKSISYPFTISKSAMFSIGSLHSWPTLLGALHWMVDLIKTAGCIDIEEVLFTPSFNDEDHSRNYEKAFLQYYAQTYVLYMRDEDEASTEERKMLETSIIAMAGCSAEDHEQLKEEVEELEAELAALLAEPDPLAEAIKEKQMLEEKIEQDEIRIRELDQKSAVLKKQAQQYEKQLQDEGFNIRQLGDRSAEMRHKGAEVKRQLERLNNEGERVEQQNNEREIRYCQLYDQINTSINEYNDIVKELMLQPHITKHLGENSIILNFEHNTTDISEVKRNLMGILKKLSEAISEDCYNLDSKIINEEMKIQRMREEINDKNEHLDQLDIQIKKLESMLQEKLAELDELTGVSKKVVDQEIIMENDLKQMAAKLKKEKENVKNIEKSVRENSERFAKIEEDFVGEILNYCSKLQEYRQNVKAGATELNKSIQADIDHMKGLSEDLQKHEQ